MYGLVSTILLHPEHETTTAAASGGGGPGVVQIAIGVLAVAGLVVGLYLLAGSVDFRGEETVEDEPGEETAGSEPAEDPAGSG